MINFKSIKDYSKGIIYDLLIKTYQPLFYSLPSSKQKVEKGIRETDEFAFANL
jgi:hypothetical protein